MGAAEPLALALSDDLVVALFGRARELGLLEEPARWAEVEGVADHLGVSVRRVRDLRERGLPAIREGRRLLFNLSEVDAWLEGRARV